MALYAISDLHLAFNEDKPMDIFGENWFMHHERIKENWIKQIKEEDTVLIAGDISWSMKMEDGLEDLNWIHNLPGRKILVKGNHDYWWTSINKLNNLYEDMNFIQNNCFIYEDYAICGTRGWTPKPSDNFTQHDEKIYSRELIRLRLSLECAKKQNINKIIVMMHYPPTSNPDMDSPIMDLVKEYNVEKVIYGHLHGNKNKRSIEKIKDGIEYILTSCDNINFNPIKIL